MGSIQSVAFLLIVIIRLLLLFLVICRLSVCAYACCFRLCGICLHMSQVPLDRLRCFCLVVALLNRQVPCSCFSSHFVVSELLSHCWGPSSRRLSMPTPAQPPIVNPAAAAAASIRIIVIVILLSLASPTVPPKKQTTVCRCIQVEEEGRGHRVNWEIFTTPLFLPSPETRSFYFRVLLF